MKRIIVLIMTALWVMNLMSQEAPVKWLTQVQDTRQGQSFGIPWEKGKVQKNQMFILKTSTGKIFPVQTWPLAFWPDGSVKWSGMAVSLSDKEQGPFLVQGTKAFTPENPLIVTRNAKYFQINTGLLQVRIPLSGNNFIEEMVLNGNTVVSGGQLICTIEDRSQFENNGIIRYQKFTGKTSRVTLEQSGPVRAVVKIEGKHLSLTSQKEWLPFSIYLYFYAGQSDVRMVHSIVFDGDEKKDFIKELSIVFNVPFREEIQNRHVAFSGEKGGLWDEPIQPLDGRRMISHPAMRNPYQVQLTGERIPDKATYTEPNRQLLTDFAVWDGFKLVQSSPNGFTITKRTGTESSWLAAGAGNRSEGLVYAGDVSGGLAVSLKNFWQSFPVSLEVQKTRSPEGQLKVCMWSPDAQAMDLRHYDTIAHGLNSTYEDVQEGLSTPYGVARTSELMLFPQSSVPSKEKMATMSHEGAEPARLVSTPVYYHQAGAFGNLWSLPDRSTPVRLWIENQLDSSILYYRKMIDQHYWYGFWNYGDIMHSQDPPRHVWRYDIGGMAWDNSELAPDMWLWYSFLRSGDPGTFKMAEAMTRHTGEVDCYHIGRLKGLGSRHNVSHWGCGAKEARIAQAGFRRFYYYLTTDERVGDIMREMIDAENSIVNLDPMRLALPFDQAPVKAPARLRFGPDWISLVSNWMTEWERTGDTKWRDKIVTGMTCFSKMPHGIFSGKGVFGFDPATDVVTLEEDQSNEVHSMHLATIMGGAEMMFELLSFLDHKEFMKSWLEYCEYYSMPKNDPSRSEKNVNLPVNGFLIPRLTAYAALAKNDPRLAERAWSEFSGRSYSNRSMYSTQKVYPPEVMNELDENRRISTNSVAQWGLNGIFLPGIIGDKKP
ncbi:MAG: hypothetical protein NT092_01950 [Bacteroidia bacterium]|nr:hypothetical protein [Bacteroidia bacterium]